MTVSPSVAPVQPSRTGRIHPSPGRLVLATLTVGAAATAAIVLATRADGEALDYGVGVVPVLVPWLAAGLAVVLALIGWRQRWAASVVGSLFLGALTLLTAWSIVMLPFDLLRIIGLVPLPLSGWGLALRLLLLLAAAASIIPALQGRKGHQRRCPACGRVLPASLDRLPRWPMVVALVAALVYPVLRILWALGGTFGTTGQPLELDPAIAWGVVIVGAVPVVFTLALLVGRGRSWVRMLLGLGGLGLGMAMAVVGGLASVRAASELAVEGIGSSQGDELMTWTFVLVYGSWFVAGVGIMAGGWRFWAHRREDCSACRTLLGR